MQKFKRWFICVLLGLALMSTSLLAPLSASAATHDSPSPTCKGRGVTQNQELSSSVDSDGTQYTNFEVYLSECDTLNLTNGLGTTAFAGSVCALASKALALSFPAFKIGDVGCSAVAVITGGSNLYISRADIRGGRCGVIFSFQYVINQDSLNPLSFYSGPPILQWTGFNVRGQACQPGNHAKDLNKDETDADTETVDNLSLPGPLPLVSADDTSCQQSQDASSTDSSCVANNTTDPNSVDSTGTDPNSVDPNATSTFGDDA